MSEENISLYDLLNLSIGTNQKGCVNFTALHALLLAVLKQLDIREVTIRWKDPLLGDRAPSAAVDVGSQDQQLAREGGEESQRNSPGSEQRVRSGIEPPESSSGSLTSASGSVAEGQGRIRSRSQTPKGGASEVNGASVEQVVGKPGDSSSLQTTEFTDGMSLTEEPTNQRAELQGGMEEPTNQRADRKGGMEEPTNQRADLQGGMEKPTNQRADLQGGMEKPTNQRADLQGGMEEPTNQRADRKGGMEEPTNQRADRKGGMEEPTNQRCLKELFQQSKMTGNQVDMMAVMEKCCHRVDVLEGAMSSLRVMFQSNPDADDQDQSVSWDVIQSAPLSERENLLKEAVKSGVFDGTMMTKPTRSPAGTPPTNPSSSSSSSYHSATPAAPGSPTVSGKMVIPLDAADISEASPSLSGSPPPTGTEADWADSGAVLAQMAGGSERHPETMEVLKKIQGRFSQLEARIVALEERKADLDTNKGSRDASANLRDQLNKQKAMIESLMSDREKLDNLEEMLMSLMSQDRESSSDAASQSVDTDSKGFRELSQQVSYLRKSLHKLEEDMKHLRTKQAQWEESSADQNLQDQLDELRGMLEEMMLSFTSQLSSGLQDEEEQDSSESQDLSQNSQRSVFTAKTVNVGRKLSLLFQHYEELQDTVNGLMHQQSGGRAGRTPEDKGTSRNVGLVSDVQKVILELQADCEKLHESTKGLHEDNRTKQGHIQELYKMTEELEGKKADRLMVENNLKAEKTALDGKVSRLQFDSATEQLNAMFHELLNKVTGQEQDWHKVVNQLSTEMECKLNRIELDSMKKQLEDRWKNIHEKLRAQGAPEHEDAAAIRKQLVERFHCLSCDRPVVKQVPGPQIVTLPSSPAFPSHKSMRAFTIYGGMEQLRRHYRSERIAELTDYSQLAVPRSCGGNHTTTSSGQRRSGLQQTKLHSQPEVDGVFQEVDIIGLDGHIYKGRVNVPSMKNSENKLPTISSKDGMCKTKDKAKSSASHRPAAALEVGHNTPVHQSQSAKSMQCSRSASSCSGRDWPVSALGCYTSQSSITPASAAGGSAGDQPVGGDAEP